MLKYFFTFSFLVSAIPITNVVAMSKVEALTDTLASVVGIEECAICMEGVWGNSIECDHCVNGFHHKCVNEWLETCRKNDQKTYKEGFCPICRGDLSEETEKKIVRYEIDKMENLLSIAAGLGVVGLVCAFYIDGELFNHRSRKASYKRFGESLVKKIEQAVIDGTVKNLISDVTIKHSFVLNNSYNTRYLAYVSSENQWIFRAIKDNRLLLTEFRCIKEGFTVVLLDELLSKHDISDELRTEITKVYNEIVKALDSLEEEIASSWYF